MKTMPKCAPGFIPEREIEVIFLFGNHKFWKNTRNKCKIMDEGPLLGSCLFKHNLAVINLFDTQRYIQMKDLKFEDVFADILTNAITHESLHLVIMQEISVSAEAEEKVIYSMIGPP